ncbi:BCL2 modifying factor 2 [Callorhinchus milii]|uniref:Bcl-2-modifying factor n=1 Tax=Callorhinchus milii TaxID=7868 RepID=A0A4W3JXA1_CALMI|nr:BCL2 modifying factor 2 [Callorhinchus milii]XP_007891387.1 BCL2 modifying factor 2 [Callorhinchus milii]|eukprot:gi/632951588/ref/XP_007891385.1/ PREDICTED: bcl-2-modifying factor [Callorhinchus milii]
MDLSDTEELDSDDEVFAQDLTAPDSGYSDNTSGTHESLTWRATRSRLRSPINSVHFCGPGCGRQVQCDKATQTPTSIPGSDLAEPSLPGGVGAHPRRLFYGNAGYRLGSPEVFEVPRSSGLPHQGRGDGMPMELQPEDRVEVGIGRKLQQIGDQFHSSCMERHHRMENHVDQPFWWRLLVLLFAMIFDPEENRAMPGQR